MAKSPTTLTPALQERLETLGLALRARRKALRLRAVVVAEAAGISRVTLHRIERGHPSVAMGAYFATAAALGVDLTVRDQPSHQTKHDAPRRAGWIPIEIRLEDYPELRRLDWQLAQGGTLTPREALDIYIRNFRHIDEEALLDPERQLISDLRRALGESVGTSSGSASPSPRTRLVNSARIPS
jgi:transcriptional regulator with XRE-family HTH domain